MLIFGEHSAKKASAVVSAQSKWILFIIYAWFQRDGLPPASNIATRQFGNSLENGVVKSMTNRVSLYFREGPQRIV